ncbi:MAG: rhodanese-like domain-containing protein [Pseudomonadota bacterium]
MAQLKIAAAEMVARARRQILEMETQDLMARLGEEGLVIVDIRDVRERARAGWIPGSFHAPRGMLEFWVDPESPYHKPIFGGTDKSFVFHCASGWRSALSTLTLREMGFDAAHLREGFQGWVAAGGPVETGSD